MSGPGTRTHSAALYRDMNDVLTAPVGEVEPVVGVGKVSVVAVSVGLL